jgi:hypothetical protein
MRNWYYGQGGQQIGPVAQEALTTMIQQRILSPDTLLWSEGMPNWAPVKEIFPALVPFTPSFSAPLAGYLPPVILTKCSIIIVILMTMVSMGFYPLLWLWERRNELNLLNTTVKLSKGILITTLVTNVVAIIVSFCGGVLWNIGESADDSIVMGMGVLISLLGFFISIAFWVMMLTQVFKVKKMLQEHFNGYLQRKIEFSGFFTFFFHIAYLQYKINRLE